MMDERVGLGWVEWGSLVTVRRALGWMDAGRIGVFGRAMYELCTVRLRVRAHGRRDKPRDGGGDREGGRGGISSSAHTAQHVFIRINCAKIISVPCTYTYSRSIIMSYPNPSDPLPKICTP